LTTNELILLQIGTSDPREWNDQRWVQRSRSYDDKVRFGGWHDGAIILKL